MAYVKSMASFLLLIGFIFVAVPLAKSQNSLEWDVERSSINPLSYTDEENYSRDRTTEDPELPSLRSSQIYIPDILCPDNEHYEIMTRSCDSCNNFRKEKNSCWSLVPKCVCNKGLARSEGKCIKFCACPGENVCPKGEEYSACQAHCERDCTKEKDSHKCQRICISGCTCKKGLVRGPDGTCIYPTECPTPPPTTPPIKVCPENEVYNNITATCQQNCTNINSALPCPRINQPGCVCIEPLIRGISGKCCDRDQCPKRDSPEDDIVTLNPPPYTDDDYPIPESVTEDSLISEKENQLIPQVETETRSPYASQQEGHDCPMREKWMPCGAHCQRNCSTKDEKDFRCRPICVPGCVCEEGLVRGPDDNCIEKDECPPTSDSEAGQFFCGKLEIPSLFGSCPDDCDNYKDVNRPCKKRFTLRTCICRSNYVRGPSKNGKKGDCILPSECPVTCRKDEIFNRTRANCEKDCSNWATNLICPQNPASGCVCRPGYVRGPEPERKCLLWMDCMDKPEENSDVTSTETSPQFEYTDVTSTETSPQFEYTDVTSTETSPQFEYTDDDENSEEIQWP